MDDDLRKIPTFVRLSQVTRAALIYNSILVLGIKAVFLMLILVGLGTIWMTVFADVVKSLLVDGDGLERLPSDKFESLTSILLSIR